MINVYYPWRLRDAEIYKLTESKTSCLTMQLRPFLCLEKIERKDMLDLIDVISPTKPNYLPDTYALLLFKCLQISIFFDLLFMLQHYVLYPGKTPVVSQKADEESREALIAPPDRSQSEGV